MTCHRLLSLRTCLLLGSAVILLSATPKDAHAGMPSVSLTDLARMRLDAISFFLAVLVGCSLGVKLIWNSFAKDFEKLPSLSFGKAFGLVALWGMLCVVVLTMISGARELMTPGAWQKDGSMNPTRNKDGYALAHYAGNLRLLGRSESDSGRLIPDGHSTTILAGQVRFRFRPWGAPDNLRDPAAGLGTRTDGFWGNDLYTFFVMADGRVQTVRSDIDPRVLKALSTPDSGDDVPSSFSR